MLTIENGYVSGEEIYKTIESRDSNFNRWITKKIQYADLKEGVDFLPKVVKNSIGRPYTVFNFTIEAAKEICLLEKNEKGKELRRWLIEMSNKRENLELITVKEAAFAVKVINCLKYLNNQKDAFKLHQETYVKENIELSNPKYIYAEFAKYRAKIVGWDKERTDKAILEYLQNNAGYDRNKVMQKDMSTKISILEPGEAIRVAVLDILYSNHEDSELAGHFSELCKNMAKEMNIQIEKENKRNLFKEPESIDSVTMLAINSK